MQTTQAVVYIAAQMLAGFVAYRVGQQLLGTPLHDIAGKNVDWRVITAEALGAFVLGLGVAAAVYQLQEGGKLAATVGLSLMLGIVLASLGSNAAINPAVALGTHSWNASYVVGPIIGAITGMNLYAALFVDTDKATRSKKRS